MPVNNWWTQNSHRLKVFRDTLPQIEFQTRTISINRAARLKLINFYYESSGKAFPFFMALVSDINMVAIGRK